MSPAAAACVVWLFAYLIGAVPFGYVVGRLKGKNLFREGSGNIGATNVGRVLGRPYGILVFILDFLKGAIPTGLAPMLVRLLSGSDEPAFGITELDRVGAAAFSFLGHLFPIFLGFRGGKGVATGAGAALMVAPIPAIVAVLAWITVVLTTRMVSLSSIIAAAVLIAVRIAMVGFDGLAGTAFCLIGSLFVIVKHKSNISRILANQESRITAPTPILIAWHTLALGLSFGGAAFFNFVAAPAIFDSFKNVVASQPSDRTANIRILPENANDDTKKALASSLAGSAVGPIFPKYFTVLTVCGLIAVVTSFTWRHRGRVHRIRTAILLAALIITIVGWPISGWVAQLRIDRFANDADVALHAQSLFGPVHLISLALSAIGTLLTGIGLVLVGWIPRET